MNVFTPCEPAMPGAKAEMRIEEAQALDILMHLIRPQLVVECGTYYGGSAAIFARHAPVITFDPAPKPEAAQSFVGRPITQVIGSAPHELPMLDSMIQPAGSPMKRWMFFHDSVHEPEFLIAELNWAFSRGAVCAAWHDVALANMLDALPKLQAAGYEAFRMMDFGLERSSWTMGPLEIWQGLGFCWNK